MCKCRKRQRRRAINDQDGKTSVKQSKKKAKRKEVSFQLPNSQKSCVAITNDLSNSLVCAKMNGNLTITDNNQQEMLLYLGSAPPNISISDHCGSPQDIRNPDLINDAESLRHQRNNSEKHRHHDTNNAGELDELQQQRQHAESDNSVVQRMMQQQPQSRFMSSLPRNINMRDMYQVDVHLNPGCFVDANGYPIEYIPIINQSQLNYNSANGFATLPHNRNKSSSSGPLVRLSNEAEFITRTSQTFQTYNSPDVRYTAEGYPCIVDPHSQLVNSLDTQNFPSPPEGYKSTNDAITSTSLLPATISIVNSQNFLHHPQQFSSSASSQSSAVVPKWPSCLPAPSGYPTPQYEPPTSTTTTKNVRFQLTPLQEAAGSKNSDLCENNVIHEEEEEDDDDEQGSDETGNHTKCRQLKGRPLADSPDEGYVGDSQESSDMWQQKGFSFANKNVVGSGGSGGGGMKTLEAILQTEDVVVL